MGQGAASGQSGSTLATNADILVRPGDGTGVVVLMNANPIQVLGMPRGAADLAGDVMRVGDSQVPSSTAPTVRTVYAVIDAVLAMLALLLLAHVWRGRTWQQRWVSHHGRGLAIRTLVADLLLPIGVLLGVPLAIGATGSSRAGDVVNGWQFVLWTLPDLALAGFVLTAVPIALGAWKGWVAVHPMAPRSAAVA